MGSLYTITFLTVAVAVLSSFVTQAAAGFSAFSANNIAIYWGQNSYGSPTGLANAQQRLSYYCSNADIDIIPLAFMISMNSPVVNFANAGDNCTVFSGTTLLDCPQLDPPTPSTRKLLIPGAREDINTCQSTYGKTILLSIGGATYTEGGFSSKLAAEAAADNVWAMFGPVQPESTVNRPFGQAVIDGFDFDFEATTSNMAPFASALRSKMNAATAGGDKPYYLSAAPQCPYPDVADKDMLDGAVPFDLVMVQFYNNYCGLQSFVPGSATQNNFDFSIWDNWAKTVSNNTNVRVLIGIPGGATAAGSGYVSASSLAPIITYAKQFSSFGGIMVWDMSQIYANVGYLENIVQDLGSGSTTTAMTIPSTQSTSATQGTEAMLSSTKPLLPATTTWVSSTALSGGNGIGSCSTISTTTETVTAYITVTATGCSTKTQDTINTEKGMPSTKTTTTTTTTTTASTSIPVKQWGQCGGIGYTGSTQCQSPYSCVYNSVWWAQCQ